MTLGTLASLILMSTISFDCVGWHTTAASASSSPSHKQTFLYINGIGDDVVSASLLGVLKVVLKPKRQFVVRR
jgi:hypothetical protein